MREGTERIEGEEEEDDVIVVNCEELIVRDVGVDSGALVLEEIVFGSTKERRG